MSQPLIMAYILKRRPSFFHTPYFTGLHDPDEQDKPFALSHDALIYSPIAAFAFLMYRPAVPMCVYAIVPQACQKQHGQSVQTSRPLCLSLSLAASL